MICVLPLTFAGETTFLIGVVAFGEGAVAPGLARSIALLFRRGAIEGGFPVETDLDGTLFPMEL